MEVLYEKDVAPEFRIKDWQIRLWGLNCEFPMPPDLYVNYDGRIMNMAWAILLRQAQLGVNYKYRRKLYPRISFGADGEPKEQRYCPVCLTSRGKMHLHRCDEERCPVCLKSTLVCLCPAGDPVMLRCQPGAAKT